MFSSPLNSMGSLLCTSHHLTILNIHSNLILTNTSLDLAMFNDRYQFPSCNRCYPNAIALNISATSLIRTLVNMDPSPSLSSCPVVSDSYTETKDETCHRRKDRRLRVQVENGHACTCTVLYILNGDPSTNQDETDGGRGSPARNRLSPSRGSWDGN